MGETEIKLIFDKLDGIDAKLENFFERLIRIEERHNSCKEITAKRIEELTNKPEKHTNAIAKWVGIFGGALGVFGALYAYIRNIGGNP